MQSNITTSYDHGQTGTKINTEQVDQIIKAIMAGKYSLACFLMLRFTGSEPRKYIPYRTYIRVLKNYYLLPNSPQNLTPSAKRLEMESDLLSL